MSTRSPVASAPTGGSAVSLSLSSTQGLQNLTGPIRRLQTIIHSIMAGRIVFHVVETTSKDISLAELSLEAALSQCCLTTHIEMEDVAVPPG